MDYSYLLVSDGTGDAALMNITGSRATGSTTITVDSVTSVPAKFIATSGTKLATGLLDPATLTTFKGHVAGSTLVIDSYVPGSTDKGNTAGQLVIIKPNTEWSNEVVGLAQVSHNNDGTLKTGIVTSTQLAANSVNSVAIVTGAVLKNKLDAPHRIYKYYADPNGQVFPANTDNNMVMDTTVIVVGMTANTDGTVTIARDGMYALHQSVYVKDSPSVLCPYFDVTYPAGYLGATSGTGLSFGYDSARQTAGQMGIGARTYFDCTVFLPAGTVLTSRIAVRGNATRVGSIDSTRTKLDTFYQINEVG